MEFPNHVGLVRETAVSRHVSRCGSPVLATSESAMQPFDAE
jgi:hypothetical protein